MVKSSAKRKSRKVGLKALNSKVNRLIKAKESHVHTNVAWASQAIDASADDLICITNIATGDDQDDRHGRLITIKSVHVTGFAEQSASATNSNLRLVLVQDRLGTTTQPTITDVFGVASYGYNFGLRDQAAQPMSRFKILWDKKIIFSSVDKRRVALNYYKRCNIPVRFSGSTATDEGKNALYLMGISDESTNTPTVHVYASIRFEDN